MPHQPTEAEKAKAPPPGGHAAPELARPAITRDLSPTIRLVEKICLMLRYVWRFPKVGGAWPKYEYLKPWFAALRPATVVDVGVNRGQFLHLAMRLFPGARILGIEPLAELHGPLQARFTGNELVRLECCACGAMDGSAALYVTSDDQNTSTHRPTEAFYDERAGEKVLETRDVPVRRLDRLLADAKGPILLKIDVQGGEMDVLEGLGARLGDVDCIVIEAPFERAYEGAADFGDIYRFLTGHGFTYCGAMGQLNSPATGHVRQEDSVYLRRSPYGTAAENAGDSA